MASRRRAPKLSRYTKKRPGPTPEPPGIEPPRGSPGDAGPRFVVQLHGARRLHYDFRLEHEGVLLSWAVPKGPSMDPKDRRLAVRVEDHPLDYAGFEGVIPEGQYGAGPVVIWDRGAWRPDGDVAKGLREGKLHFSLEGYKLRGRFLLVRMGEANPKAGRRKKEGEPGEGEEWLLRKERDAVATDAPPASEESVLSGLSLDEVREGGTARVERVRAALRDAKAPRRRVDAAEVGLMLASPSEAPFSAPGWLFEIKYDGWRLLAAREREGEGRLLLRGGGDAGAQFPEVRDAVAALPFEGLILDGEVVVLDDEGRPSFSLLQARARPAVFFAFDLLACEGHDLRPLPLAARKEILRQVVPLAGPVRFCDHVEAQGEDLYRAAVAAGLEGVIAKDAASRYAAGRSREWRKVRAQKGGDFVVVGFTPGKGTRAGFGALDVAAYEGKRLVYAGRVGTGFSGRALAEMRRRLEPLRRATPPCEGEDLPRERGHAWVEPQVVIEVRYAERTAAGLLRQPAFLRVREDKKPEECRMDQDIPPPLTLSAGAAKRRRSRRAEERSANGERAPTSARVVISHADKIFWPREGYTKGDLAAYYASIAPVLLPYLRDRPLVLDRFPNGIAGKNFYQKNAPQGTPSWVRTAPVRSEHSGEDIRYIVADDLDTLMHVVNQGTIPLHLWLSRAPSIERPDFCLVDLDPKEAPFADVIRIAQALGRILERARIESCVKTSGKSGLHVLIPLGARLTYEESRALGEVLARLVLQELPEIATIERSLADRRGRVYVDYMQNRRGSLMVAPYAVRPIAGAPVSTPIRWEEVKPGLDPGRFTIETMAARLAKVGGDLLAPVLGPAPGIEEAIARLAEIARGAPAAAPSPPARRSSRAARAPRASPRRSRGKGPRGRASRGKA